MSLALQMAILDRSPDQQQLVLAEILTRPVAAVPLVAGFLFWPDFALGAMDGARDLRRRGISDFFDGYLARAWSQQSSLGRMLDPIADKLLVAAAILMLAADQTISGPGALRRHRHPVPEILVSGLREYLAELRVPLPSPPSRSGRPPSSWWRSAS